MLIKELTGWAEGYLNESSDSRLAGRLFFRGKFQEANAINKNKRMYPYEALNENVKRLQEAVKTGSLTGELDHPTDSVVHFKEASHKVTKLWWENNILMGEAMILSTPAGKVLRALMEDGVRIGISSRGVGNGVANNEGVMVISEGYKLITFDVVADPSTHSAFQERVVGRGGKNESMQMDEFHDMGHDLRSNQAKYEDPNKIMALFRYLVDQKIDIK